MKYCTAVRGEPSHRHNMYSKFCEIWTCFFAMCEHTDRPIDRHTDKLIAMLRAPTGGEANKLCAVSILSIFIRLSLMDIVLEHLQPVVSFHQYCPVLV